MKAKLARRMKVYGPEEDGIEVRQGGGAKCYQAIAYPRLISWAC